VAFILAGYCAVKYTLVSPSIVPRFLAISTIIEIYLHISARIRSRNLMARGIAG